MLTVINRIIFVCLLDFNWLRTDDNVQHFANARPVKLGFRKSIIAIFCDDSSTKCEVILTKIA